MKGRRFRSTSRFGCLVGFAGMCLVVATSSGCGWSSDKKQSESTPEDEKGVVVDGRGGGAGRIEAEGEEFSMAAGATPEHSPTMRTENGDTKWSLEFKPTTVQFKEKKLEEQEDEGEDKQDGTSN